MLLPLLLLSLSCCCCCCVELIYSRFFDQLEQKLKPHFAGCASAARNEWIHHHQWVPRVWGGPGGVARKEWRRGSRMLAYPFVYFTRMQREGRGNSDCKLLLLLLSLLRGLLLQLSLSLSIFSVWCPAAIDAVAAPFTPRSSPRSLCQLQSESSIFFGRFFL